MATRSVRLDAEAEAALLELQEKTGASLSTLLKRGLLALREQDQRSKQTAWEHYRAIMDATSDADAATQPMKRRYTAKDSRKAVRKILDEKRRRGPR